MTESVNLSTKPGQPHSNRCWSQVIPGWEGCSWGDDIAGPFDPNNGPCDYCHNVE